MDSIFPATRHKVSSLYKLLRLEPGMSAMTWKRKRGAGLASVSAAPSYIMFAW